MPEEGEMIHIGQRREIIGISKGWLIVLLVVKRKMWKIMGGYIDGDWGNSDFQGDRAKNRVNFTENDNNYSSIALEFGDIECWHTDSEAGLFTESYLG